MLSMAKLLIFTKNTHTESFYL